MAETTALMGDKRAFLSGVFRKGCGLSAIDRVRLGLIRMHLLAG